MPSVSNLKLALQKGTDSTYFASWDFKETIKKTTSNSNLKAGDWVTIKSGATYYNGVSIPSWVMKETWKIVQITRGDRAVLGKSKSGNYDIQSPISTKYLNGGSSSTTTTTETTNYLDHYYVKWFYATGDGYWFDGSSSEDVKRSPTTYGAPSNATKVKVAVKPISKTHKVNDKDVEYWTGSWVYAEIVVSSTPPTKPSTPSVEIDEKYKLTTKIENISDARTDQILFEVYSGNKRVNTSTVTVQTCRASFSCTVSVGSDYRVRCRAINLVGNTKVYSDWSDFSSGTGTVPAKVTSFDYIKALSETSVGLQWASASGATGYTVEYTTKKDYFDSSTQVSSMSVKNVRHAEVTGLETGNEYFFRVKATNEKGESPFSSIVSIVIGKKPSAPTTWSSTTTLIVGEPLTLYWVHNAEDGSSQKYAELEMYIGGTKETRTIKNSTDEDEKDKTSYYIVDTSTYKVGTTIQWRVRTAGVTKEYGDWSVQRTVDIYASPTLELRVTDKDGTAIDTLSSFPFYISGLAGPSTQSPIGYHLIITANNMYETVDTVGNAKIVNAGEEVYSKYFDMSDPLLVEMSANNLDLENNNGYKISCVVSMNSGLTAEASAEFTVNWVEVAYEPDAEIGINEDVYSAYISPYCISETGEPIEDLMLSVYRREFDGSFTEIATGIDTKENTYITDPHPALDYARYRIVATSKSTGAVSYYDPPGYPVGGTSIIIQWNEDWSNFDAIEADGLEDQPWTGSMLKLPYNIDVSDSNSPDATLVSYIGRQYPVSYYGTQIGSTATWTVEIPADDKETLYALRRLARWMGDVYVREPSGSGYWANIKVSFSQKHCELTMPVTMNITRVEGGI